MEDLCVHETFNHDNGFDNSLHRQDITWEHPNFGKLFLFKDLDPFLL